MNVPLYGGTADLDAILGIAKRHKLVVIEDACQAHEGGALTTNDDAVAHFAREMQSRRSEALLSRPHAATTIGWMASRAQCLM